MQGKSLLCWPLHHSPEQTRPCVSTATPTPSPHPAPRRPAAHAAEFSPPSPTTGDQPSLSSRDGWNRTSDVVAPNHAGFHSPTPRQPCDSRLQGPPSTSDPCGIRTLPLRLEIAAVSPETQRAKHRAGSPVPEPRPHSPLPNSAASKLCPDEQPAPQGPLTPRGNSPAALRGFLTPGRSHPGRPSGPPGLPTLRVGHRRPSGNHLPTSAVPHPIKAVGFEPTTPGFLSRVRSQFRHALRPTRCQRDVSDP